MKSLLRIARSGRTGRFGKLLLALPVALALGGCVAVPYDGGGYYSSAPVYPAYSYPAYPAYGYYPAYPAVSSSLYFGFGGGGGHRGHWRR